MPPTKRPRSNPFTQQTLPAWQPILSPHWVIITFILIFIIFTPIGIALIFASGSVAEYEEDYTGVCAQNRTAPGYAPYCVANLTFTIPTRMEAPVYMYYKLENFYQNHRRYASSRSDSQLGGNIIDPSAARSACSPIWAYGTSDNPADYNATQIYNPCGLVAWSMFNDTLSLYKYDDSTQTTASLVCSGAHPLGSEDPDPNSKCTKNGIAWASDRDVKFKSPTGADAVNRMYPLDYYNELGHTIPKHDDEDFMVWMRTAALPSFRKLYRIINVDLDPGTYFFEIQNRYPVEGFSGRKSVVLSTVSFLGGKNLFLAISYVSVGGLCLILAGAFFVGWLTQLFAQKMKNRSRA